MLPQLLPPLWVQGSKATDVTRMSLIDLFSRTCVQSSLHFRPCIIFPGCNEDSTPHGFSHFCCAAEAPVQRQAPSALALHPVLEDGLCWSSLLGSAHLLKVSLSTGADATELVADALHVDTQTNTWIGHRIEL